MARVKVKDHEKLTDANIQHVLNLLEADKPITKKVACEILNISYNTTRLSNILEGYKAKQERYDKMRAANKGKPASDYEILTTAQSYLKGCNVSDIAKSLYRSPSFVRGILTKLGVPQKGMGEDKFKPSLLPDKCVRESFESGQKAWSAAYHAPCEVLKEVRSKATEGRVYQVYVFEQLDEPIEGFPKVTVGGFYAYQPAYELGSLEHLINLGVKIE
jgi:hypothetical protein